LRILCAARPILSPLALDARDIRRDSSAGRQQAIGDGHVAATQGGGSGGKAIDTQVVA
jgi:hypothetical protein